MNRLVWDKMMAKINVSLMAKMNNSGNVPEGIYKCTSRSITNDNYEDSIKSKRELSHMWDERRCDEPHLDEDLIMGISSHQM